MLAYELALRRRRRRKVKALSSGAGTALILAIYYFMWPRNWPNPHQNRKFDAVVVPGGGLDAKGTPLPWVTARLDTALRHDKETNFYLVLSRGTTHKPPPRDNDGFSIDESAASASYLTEHGVEPSRILLESWSLDTIGNAAFARIFHAEIQGWQRILVVTTTLHLRRTRMIFDWVFSLKPLRYAQPEIVYEAVDESDAMTEEQRESRARKEDASIQKLRSTMSNVNDLRKLHNFLFIRHAAYAAPSADMKVGMADVDRQLLSTY